MGKLSGRNSTWINSSKEDFHLQDETCTQLANIPAQTFDFTLQIFI